MGQGFFLIAMSMWALFPAKQHREATLWGQERQRCPRMLPPVGIMCCAQPDVCSSVTVEMEAWLSPMDGLHVPHTLTFCNREMTDLPGWDHLHCSAVHGPYVTLSQLVGTVKHPWGMGHQSQSVWTQAWWYHLASGVVVGPWPTSVPHTSHALATCSILPVCSRTYVSVPSTCQP